MAEKTAIQWSNSTWTPIRARNRQTGKVGWFCEHVSRGCDNCYAEKKNKNSFFGNGLPYKASSLPQLELFLDEKMLTKPLHWKKPKMVFVCSMTDLFARFVPDEWIDRVFAVMALALQHKFQVLTKRPERMLAYMQRLARNIAPLENAARELGYTFKFKGVDGKEYGTLPWPIPSVWLGTSIENQETANERIPHLLHTPASVRFISAEPLLGAVDLQNLKHRICSDDSPLKVVGGCIEEYDALRGEMIHNQLGYDVPKLNWVIVGGESGARARPCDIGNVRSIVEACTRYNVPVFVKQLGSIPVWNGCGLVANNPKCLTSQAADGSGLLQLHPSDRKGSDIAEFPEDLRIRQFPHA